MPRFYFHLQNSIGRVADPDGRELADLDAARQAAREELRSLIAEGAKGGVIDLHGWIELADHAGVALARVPFVEAVELRLPTA